MGEIWAIPTEFVYVVQNGGAELEADSSAYFTSYRTAVRAVMRVGFGFAQQAAIVRLCDAADPRIWRQRHPRSVGQPPGIDGR